MADLEKQLAETNERTRALEAEVRRINAQLRMNADAVTELRAYVDQQMREIVRGFKEAVRRRRG